MYMYETSPNLCAFKKRSKHVILNTFGVLYMILTNYAVTEMLDSVFRSAPTTSEILFKPSFLKQTHINMSIYDCCTYIENSYFMHVQNCKVVEHRGYP